jgi:hypothetical protein
MKYVIVLATLALFSIARADVTFVQNLDLGIPMEDAADVTIRATADKYRIDLGTDMSSIVDTKSATVVTVMHDDRTFFKMENYKSSDSTAPAPPPLTLTKTNRTETIAGFQASAWTAEADGMKFTVWTTDGLPDQGRLLADLAALPPEIDPFHGILRGTKLIEGFPIRLEIIDEDGAKSTLTITSISGDPVTSDHFVPPSGYQSLEPVTGRPKG